MRLTKQIFFIIISLLYIIYAKETKEKLTESEYKSAVVECANTHLEYCEKLLKQGVPDIKTCNVRTECEFVGWLYSQVQNYTRSLPYLKKACDNNHKDGCDKLGFSYQRLNNYKKAKKYYKVACEKGSMSGCYNFAMLYYDGLGVRHSYEKANLLFEKICDNGEGIGCLQIGVSYLKGYGVIQNYEKSNSFFKRGCELGNNEACDFFDSYKNSYENDNANKTESNFNKEQ